MAGSKVKAARMPVMPAETAAIQAEVLSATSSENTCNK
jgi:hypothetical protein